MPFVVGSGALRGGGQVPLVVAFLTPNIDIWALFGPKKHETSPQAISNQNELTETKKTCLIFSGTVPLKFSSLNV